MPHEVMTVLGPISGDKLGFTLIHEHIFLDMMRDAWAATHLLDDPELAHLELQRYKDAGGVTIVDQTSGGLRENDHNLLYDEELNHVKHAVAVKQMSEKTGINVILGCGWYRETYARAKRPPPCCRYVEEGVSFRGSSKVLLPL